MLAPPVADVAHSTFVSLAFDGSQIDGGLYTDITDWARTAPSWLDSLIKYWSAYGIVIFAVLMLLVWWSARRQPSGMMTRVLAAPIVVVVAYVANDLLKSVVQERRPCQQIPHSFNLETCAGPGDWAFPSNHTVVAFSAAVALLLIHRRIGWLAVLAATAMGASRVYVGAHYPHDVLVGAVVGIVLAAVLVPLAGRLGTPLVDRARQGRLKPFLADV
ncbi:phosphatase PAP2 family protein [Streptantibioticus ferralitis]|uniref:Phosphatase PAP2 family protein n=1 Tax=Streptantibioticus ferralitis TaxID=236510 RepID=A0ABT5ZAW6_9ACTN|nr:phosphatase PAP2 family protein [Streptantibioticus ferralitis]MDF2260686.1 phosphatase PAP2 family protein [Streptantibioticus ferralitis]